jgi:tetratricopeptide (TPR) repeat protein
MAGDNVAAQIGQAWLNHRQGNNDVAVDQFGRILRNNPDSIDANYGLGLANSATGNYQAASEAFERALALTEKVEATSQEERDRDLMLSRMIRQRLEEIRAASPTG